ncbi:spore-associated protein A [Nocardiopsis sp. NPDC006198]|uniref:spore-associated protein A n=1 Tax=Nocardiopsis sp. NPDC006198 TaxID=3154472 RepID=UPI0033B7ADB0
MRLLKKSLATAVATLALVAGGAFTAAPASAAGYNGACGAGYGVVNAAQVPNNLGTVFLTYNNSNGYHCAVTIRNNPGPSVHMDVWLRRAGDPSSLQQDMGVYISYAGPVYVYGRGSCMQWGGSIDGNEVNPISLPCN